jgi:hypothetical protein
MCVLLAGTSLNAKSQQADIELSIEVTDASSRIAADGAIHIEVVSNGLHFTYMLYDKEPWKGGKKLESDTKSGTTFSFSNLKSGKYYVCVQNKDKATKCTNVSIKPKK